MNAIKHEPVLLDETIEYLNPKPNENFIDGTVGDGGHAAAILELTAPGGKLIGFDRDRRALERANRYLSKYGERTKLIHSNFKNINQYVTADFKTRGVILDLGFSLAQIKDPQRGFSFREDGPLDMRYNQSQALTAADVVNTYNEDDLAKIFLLYGGEKYARRIAKNIVVRRKKKPFERTLELVAAISEAVPKKYHHAKIHFATRAFQALRIETNNELASVEEALPEALNIITEGGRLTIIAFHSLEDRIVKKFFKKKEKEGEIKILTKKPIKPKPEEIKRNPRARSAKLRVCEKVK